MAIQWNSSRFLVISDTHGFEFEDATGPFQQPVPQVDVLIHCGDLTMVGGVSAYKNCLRMLCSIPAELKLGNHDLDLDETYFKAHLEEDDPEQHFNSVNMMNGPLAKEAGVTYLREGTHTFTLRSGATFTVYASPYTPEFCDWGFAYERDEDRFNSSIDAAEGVTSITSNPIPSFQSESGGVDIIVTHGPPRSIFDRCPAGEVGCDNLLRATSRARPLMCCFGHIHEGYGAEIVTWKDGGSVLGEEAIESRGRLLRSAYPESNKVSIQRGKETLMVNAAILDGSYRANNAPWILDLELPRGPRHL